ncbi:MAG: dihydrofolate reductase [Oscillospiraceae bacterium]|nr:dihydrofolate reductase [Oscillospiraceae bacterium]
MNCIVNVTEDWGIGCEGKLLVSVSADLKRFRQLTTGKTVILGRKTLATFPGGRPLKNRTNLVLTHDPDFAAEGAVAAHNLQELLTIASQQPAQSVCVIGGESVYRALLPYCRTAQVTKTLGRYPADAFFPNLDALANWHVTAQSETMEENGVRFCYVDYENDAPQPF